MLITSDKHMLHPGMVLNARHFRRELQRALRSRSTRSPILERHNTIFPKRERGGLKKTVVKKQKHNTPPLTRRSKTARLGMGAVPPLGCYPGKRERGAR
jgi:hypothetical protein